MMIFLQSTTVTRQHEGIKRKIEWASQKFEAQMNQHLEATMNLEAKGQTMKPAKMT